MCKIILETNRLILRYQKHSDIDFLINLWTDETVTRYLGGKREKAFLYKEFTEIANNPEKEKFDLWPVELRESSEIIGYAGFLPKEIDNKEYIELSFVFSKEKWGNGYATEIAKELLTYAKIEFRLSEVISIIESNNEKSKKVVEKIGMKYWKRVLRGDKEKDTYIIKL